MVKPGDYLVYQRLLHASLMFAQFRDDHHDKLTIKPYILSYFWHQSAKISEIYFEKNNTI